MRREHIQDQAYHPRACKREARGGPAKRSEAIVFRRYKDGSRVGYTKWGDQMLRYGAPYYHIHRADFHKLLFDLAERVSGLIFRNAFSPAISITFLISSRRSGKKNCNKQALMAYSPR